MSSMIPAGSGALLKHRSFLLFLLSRSSSRFASQVAAVAIGWQVYDLTGSAFDLGMVGLVQFLPTALLVFAAGHAADRYERKRVMQLCQLAQALTEKWNLRQLARQQTDAYRPDMQNARQYPFIEVDKPISPRVRIADNHQARFR